MSQNLTNSGGPASSMALGASPFTYQNTTGSPQTILISGGTVSAIDISRDGSTFMSAGLIAGQYRLSPGDKIKITYAVAPTVNIVPT